jgi:D-3-phosphoglycerate dehydrogenase
MSDLKRIAVLDDYQNYSQTMADWSSVKAQAEVVVFNRHLSEDEAVDALQDFDAICCVRERMALPASLLRRLPRLRFIAITGVQHRTLDLPVAHAQGIVVSHTIRRGNGQFATAELAWGLIISLARQLPQEAARMKKGGWQTSCGVAIGGRTLGLLGLGRLGSHMVPIAKAFGMKVIAWSQNMTDMQASALGAQRVDKETLFRESDFLSLHVVLSERTRHVVGSAELALMKPTAYLVNTSRGPLIDGEALVQALREKRIAGAGLDTFDIEPLPDDSVLREIDEVILTPHLGYTVRELLVPFYLDTVENLLAFMSGKPIRTL